MWFLPTEALEDPTKRNFQPHTCWILATQEFSAIPYRDGALGATETQFAEMNFRPRFDAA